MTTDRSSGHDGTYLVRARDVVGLPVVTISEGEDVAEIKDVVYDAARHHLIGFTLNKRGWFRGRMTAVLRAGDVAAIGGDAVMVESSAALADRADATVPLVADSVDVIGDDVVSSNGSVLGQVVDVVLETGNAPVAVGYEVDTGDGSVFVPISAQMSVSAQNLVLPAEADEFVNHDLAGFAGAVDTFRERLAKQPLPPPDPAQRAQQPSEEQP